jgi:GxxExxY protein
MDEDRVDKQDLDQLTEKIIGCAYQVSIGEFFVDLLVVDRLLVELKAVSAQINDHIAQALNYLRASGLPVCLLINFGRPKIQIRRLHPSPNWKSSNL